MSNFDCGSSKILAIDCDFSVIIPEMLSRIEFISPMICKTRHAIFAPSIAPED